MIPTLSRLSMMNKLLAGHKESTSSPPSPFQDLDRWVSIQKSSIFGVITSPFNSQITYAHCRTMHALLVYQYRRIKVSQACNESDVGSTPIQGLIAERVFLPGSLPLPFDILHGCSLCCDVAQALDSNFLDTIQCCGFRTSGNRWVFLWSW
jgi:hypothetical protein